MADSEVSTSQSIVTRRRLLAGTAASVATQWVGQKADASAILTEVAEFDPALSIWHEWNATYLDVSALCRKQQRLETQLAKTIGFPHAEVYLPEEDRTISLHSPEQIEEFFGNDPSMAAIRARAEDELTAHKARWDDADRRIGYAAAKQAEEIAAQREQHLIDTLMSMPAMSLAGVAGRLDAILREGESSPDCPDFPWPQMRSALADLVRICQQIRPDSFIPGADRIGMSSGYSGSQKCPHNALKRT